MSAPVITHPSSIPPAEPIKRLSVDQYHAILRAGVFTDDDPIELLEGWLVEKMPKNPPHSVATGLAADELTGLLPVGWHLITQEPITLPDSEPEPDIGVVRGKRRDYVARHPGPKDVGLIVEIADTTLDRDRGVKKRIYARARIPHYWIVNLVERRLEVHTDPTGPVKKPDYRQSKVFGLKESAILILDGEEIGVVKVRDLVP
jgi:Uma2 family endonuclease